MWSGSSHIQGLAINLKTLVAAKVLLHVSKLAFKSRLDGCQICLESLGFEHMVELSWLSLPEKREICGTDVNPKMVLSALIETRPFLGDMYCQKLREGQ